MYMATFRVVALVDIPVAGDTIEAATENAKKVKHSRLVTIKGEYLHGGHALVAVNEVGSWDDDIVSL